MGGYGPGDRCWEDSSPWTQVLKLFTLCVVYRVVPKGTHNGIVRPRGKRRVIQNFFKKILLRWALKSLPHPAADGVVHGVSGLRLSREPRLCAKPLRGAGSSFAAAADANDLRGL